MNECSACRVDYYYNPDVQVCFSAVCDHRVCKPCITRLFQHGRTYPCPACGQSIRAEDFFDHPREARTVESENKVRRQICDIYCKTEEDFVTADDYNQYLEQREDTIYSLLNPCSQDEVRKTWQYIDQYREQNAEQILRVQRLQPRKKFQKILSIIEEEGAFCSNVNVEWGERLAPGAAVHPFQARYRGLLTCPPEDAPEAGRGADSSPCAPQPLLGGHGPADRARQMSGGGQPADTSLKKARHFFFADLGAATGAVAPAA